MALGLTTLFFKSAACPSSDRLLTYQNHFLPPDQMQRVTSHLAYCDFCNAELQLLKSYPAGEEESRCAEMPSHLRQLAEQLLKREIRCRPVRSAF